MFETGLAIFLGLAFIFIKLRRRTMLRLLHHDMAIDVFVTLLILFIVAVGLGISIAGCQKTTTTTEIPGGSTTTTTYSAPAIPAMSASASNALSGASQALGKAAAKPDNGALTAKVKTALFAAADVKALKIDVHSKEDSAPLWLARPRPGCWISKPLPGVPAGYAVADACVVAHLFPLSVNTLTFPAPSAEQMF